MLHKLRRFLKTVLFFRDINKIKSKMKPENDCPSHANVEDENPSGQPQRVDVDALAEEREVDGDRHLEVINLWLIVNALEDQGPGTDEKNHDDQKDAPFQQ